jgi:hypothetical protein
MRRALWNLVAFALCASACSEECVREACDDALHAQPKGSIEQGIVGVVAYRTDACENDCCECSYSTGTLKIFGTDEAVRDAEDAQARFSDQMPFMTLEVDTRYEQALEPGRYAVCDTSLRTCANIEIGRDQVLTLNLQLIFGPALMRVFDAEGARHEELVVGDGAPY